MNKLTNRRGIMAIFEFLVYLAGVIFISVIWQRIRGVLDGVSFVVLIGFYLYGVSRFAKYLSNWICEYRTQTDRRKRQWP